MQAIIMAAGVGNRISKVAGGLPKSYLSVGGETLMGRNLRMLREAGITETIIVTGHQRERFEADFVAPGVHFAFNPFFEFANVLSSFWCGLPSISGDFIYLHADTVFHEQILHNLIHAEGEVVLACDGKNCADEEMKYVVREGAITEINKSMDPACCDGEFLGVCKLASGVLAPLADAVRQVLKRGEFGAFFEVAIQELIDAGSARVTAMDVGILPWREIDFPEDYEAAKALFERQ